jgi:large subunit ribosomal protein L10
MNLEQKKAAVEDLKGLLDSAQAMFLLSQNGLTMVVTTQIRNALRKEGAAFRVVKNTMLARAVDGTPWAFVADWLKGPLALAYTDKDPVGLAKAISAFLKTAKGIELVGGAIGTKKASVADMETLASLPAPEVIKGMLLGAMTGVPKKFLGLLQAPARDFLGVLAARERQLGEQG